MHYVLCQWKNNSLSIYLYKLIFEINEHQNWIKIVYEVTKQKDFIIEAEGYLIVQFLFLIKTFLFDKNVSLIFLHY